MKNYGHMEEIELFLENKLKGDDLKEFEKHLKDDKNLAQQLSNYHLAVKEISKICKDELKSKLKYIHNDLILDQDKQKQRRTAYLRIAAVFLGLIILAVPILYYKNLKQANNDQLFTEYFSPYTNVVSNRGSEIDENNILNASAMYYYDKKEYGKALLNFEELLERTNLETSALFYYGISCLGAGEDNKAIEVLNKLSKSEDNVYYEQVIWYLALGNIKIDNKARSIELLEIMINQKGSYARKAAELLSRIK